MINAINTQAFSSIRGQQGVNPFQAKSQKPVTEIATMPSMVVPSLFNAQAKTNMMSPVIPIPNMFAAQGKNLQPTGQGAGRTLNLIG